MLSGMLGIIDNKCIHLVEDSGWGAHRTICGKRFKKNKFNTISFDSINGGNFCSDCITFANIEDETEPRYDVSRHIVSNFNYKMESDLDRPIRLFTFKVSKLQRWVRRAVGHRSIIKFKK